MSLVSELRRRQVFRAAAWYTAAAWMAIQVASTVIPQFGLPAWSVRAVIVAAVLGLPIALALAWLLDLSALGLRREVIAPGDRSNRSAVAAAVPATQLWRIPSFWMHSPSARGSRSARNRPGRGSFDRPSESGPAWPCCPLPT